MRKSQDTSQLEPSAPAHIGFIVDGNRRWAREHNLPTLEGHRLGFKKVEDIAEIIFSKGVKIASFYLFSTENWNRSAEEVSYLMDLLRHNVTKLAKKLKKQGIKMVWMGRREPAPDDIIKTIEQAERETASGANGIVVICFNYGGQWEIADAASKIVKEKVAQISQNIKAALQNNDNLNNINQIITESATITPDIFKEYLYHPEVPPCDLIVRTSGEERISGFQLWRAAYSEFLFLDKYFPEIEISDIDTIITEYNMRSRRFGK